MLSAVSAYVHVSLNFAICFAVGEWIGTIYCRRKTSCRVELHSYNEQKEETHWRTCKNFICFFVLLSLLLSTVRLYGNVHKLNIVFAMLKHSYGYEECVEPR